MSNVGIGGERGGVLEVGDGVKQVPGPYRLIPYGRNRKFTGRENLLELVRRFSEPAAHNRIALHGLGGSGKTQIALEYIYQCTGESDCHVFWVQGSGLLKFSQGFRDVAQLAQIPLASGETNEEKLLMSIKRWFEGPKSGDWVLVIDNADNDADFVGNNSSIAKFMPQGTKGTVIFTTRSTVVASRQGCEIIEVGKMGEEDAYELFSKRFRSGHSLGEEERAATTMILASVHHLPLAIIGAAAFMIETGTSPSAYWMLLQEGDEQAKRLFSQHFCDIQRGADEPESILGTYFVTFNRITQQMPTAARLLRLIVCFDRQNIPEELLSQSGLRGMDDAVQFREAIGKLLGFSLVTIVKFEGKTFYELHRLVQLSLQVYLPTKELNKAKAIALRVVSRLFPRDENDRGCIGPAYIPHALAITKDSRGPVTEDLCFRMGKYFMGKWSYNNAEIQFRRCIALRGKGGNYGRHDGGQRRFRRPGVASGYRGKNNVAIKIFWNLLGGLWSSIHLNSPDRTIYISNLAAVLQEQGKYKESETMHRRTLEKSERILGPDHPSTLTSADNLAAVLRHQGKYKESETIRRRTLEKQERILGPDHPDTLTSTNNLALVLQLQGEYDESVTMHRRTLEKQERILGPDHPSTLISTNNLASVLQDRGKHEESETMYRRTLEKRERILGPDHPDTLRSTNNLALVLQLQGKCYESGQ